MTQDSNAFPSWKETLKGQAMTEARHTEFDLPLAHRLRQSDDWGWVRDANGNLVVKIIIPYNLTDLPALIVKAVNNHQALVDALERSAQGWANVIELGLIQEQHYTTVAILRDEARAALKAVQS